MKTTLIKLIGLTAIFSLLILGGGSALAKPDIVPGGPWITDNQNVRLQRLSSYPELVKRLKKIEKTSKVMLELEVIGESNEGRNI